MGNRGNDNFPTIETERIRLRAFRLEDTKNYFNYHNSADTTGFYDWKPETFEDAENDIKLIIRDYEKMKRIQWAISLKGDDTIIGDCGIMAEGLKGEVNYMLSREYWGKGIMTEALGGLISFCFRQTDLIRIQALTNPDNESSGRLLERIGFIREGLLRKYGFNTITGQPVDLNMWAILKSEFSNFIPYVLF